MGMSSSQARLLTITGQLHDTALKAQFLMNAKLALATQEDAAYQKYCDALDATKIQVAFEMENGSIKMYDATYSTVATYQPNRCMQYALRNNKTNKIIVDENIKEAYDAFGGDKYAFAMAVLGLLGTEYNEHGQYLELGIGRAQKDYKSRNECGDSCDSGTGQSLYMTKEEYEIFSESEDAELIESYNNLLQAETDEEKRTAYDLFRNTLYDKCGKDIYEAMSKKNTDLGINVNTDVDFDEENVIDQIKYYANLHEAIREAGGCEVINAEYKAGEEGKNWFNNMVKSGLVTIQEFQPRGTKKGWSDTSAAVSTNNNYLQENQDEADEKKIEAEYQNELKIIDRKEAEFDNELNKLETVHQALKTEQEAITKIIDDNVQRTFTIFDA